MPHLTLPALLSALLVLSVTAVSGQKAKPNIILLYADDLGYTDLSCQGSDYYRTPNIARLAKEGMTFTNAYAAAANCAPSRASLMTGLYTPRHGVFTVGNSNRGKAAHRRLVPISNKTELTRKLPTMAQVLKGAGYRTAVAGKWHLSANVSTPDDSWPTRRGFDDFYGTMTGAGSFYDPYTLARNTEFTEVDGMLDFVELLADATGLPIGIKSAVGEHRFWEELANLMSKRDRGVDFICIDGGEGGTGAAPLAFSDHVALPFKVGFSRVYRILAEAGIQEDVVFIGSGKLGFPADAIVGFALGCDTINVGREAMMAVGCIQAQRCHTGHCPTGVATQNRWLMRGLDPTSKAARLANYVITLRKEVLQLSRASGAAHPGLLSGDMVEILDGRFGSSTLLEVFGYRSGWGFPSEADRREIVRVMEGGGPA